MSNRINQIREELNWTKAQLADYLGVHPRTVSRWEKGETNPSPLAAKMLLNLQQDIIMGRVKPYEEMEKKNWWEKLLRRKGC